MARLRLRESAPIRAVITRSPTHGSPQCHHRRFRCAREYCAVYSSSVTDDECAPRITIFLHQRRGRSRDVTREVALPLKVNDIQYISAVVPRGGDCRVEFWSTGTVCRGLRSQKICARTSPRNSSQGPADLGSTNTSALDGTPESARSGATYGTRSPLSTVREAHAPVLPCLAELVRRRKSAPVQVGVGVTRRWGDPSTPHRCTHGRTTR